MLNQETKKHIDNARQVLVGVVPNPGSQIDQITNALIYKFMDDMDQASIKAGGDASFFTGDLEKYSWTKLMDQKIGNQERMNLYSEALQKFSLSPQLPELFRTIFKSAFLPYRSPETLGLFLKEIDYFDYSHSEELGNAYEYLLSIMSSQGDAGQFRTPRHIIEFVVDAINPTKDDKILDPACGTGGFLVSAYKHILEQHDGKDDPEGKEKPLTPDQKRKLMQNFEGYDIDPTMARIAQVNMYLHQFKNPKIVQYDTLSQDERWNDKFDLILANPPFMSPKGGIKPHSKFSISSNRSEVLFVDYIVNHLKPNGRSGIIVPEGIIFQSGTVYKALRKSLVEDGLYAVVSLPSGVFQPYSGVKTSILLFNNEIAKKRSELLFLKIENDGFDLGTQRRTSSKNDLPQAIKILQKWHIGEMVESKLVSYVEKTKIAENGDYNLSGDRYRVATDYSKAKWPVVELGDICDFVSGYAFNSTDLKDCKSCDEDRIVIKIGNLQPEGCLNTDKAQYAKYNNSLSKFVVLESDILIAMTGATVGKVSVAQFGNLLLNQRVGLVRAQKNVIDKRFLASALLNQNFYNFCQIQAGGGAQGNISPSQIKTFKIPLPPLEIQEQIVRELDSYSAIITGAKQIVANWKPKIDIDSSWEIIKLGDVAKVYGGFAFKSEDMDQHDGEAQIIKIGNVKNQKFDYKNNQSFVKSYIYEKHKDYQLRTGDILISMTGTAGKRDYGNVCVVDIEGKFLLNQRVGKIVPTANGIESLYLFYLLNLDEVKNDFYSNATGGVRQGNISNRQIEEIKIPLPSIETQKQIVSQIEAERALVESAKKLIEIYEQKTRVTINKLWEYDE